MKKLFTLLLILSLISCFSDKGNGIDFFIENNSDFPITDVKFTTSEYLEAIEYNLLEPNQRSSDFLSMKNNRSDGGYVLEFTRNNGKRDSIGTGYFTNGGALDDWVEFKVENDTIIIVFSEVGY